MEGQMDFTTILTNELVNFTDGKVNRYHEKVYYS
jgi:hypothetical protein